MVRVTWPMGPKKKKGAGGAEGGCAGDGSETCRFGEKILFSHTISHFH